MARVVEISGAIESGMWDYGELDLGGAAVPRVCVERWASIPEHGFDAHAITVSTLTATYTETAAHMVEGGRTLDQVAIDELIRPARLVRIPAAGPRTLVRLTDLERTAPDLQDGDALIIDTGWGVHWGEPDYVRDCPAFAAETLGWFRAQPFSMLVLDTPVMECHWCAEQGLGSDEGPLLRPLYEAGMLLVAPVVNLAAIREPTGTLISLPMAVAGVSSAPCRALYVEGVSWAEHVRGASSPPASEKGD